MSQFHNRAQPLRLRDCLRDVIGETSNKKYCWRCIKIKIPDIITVMDLRQDAAMVLEKLQDSRDDDS